jgi:hypothetical protein
VQLLCTHVVQHLAILGLSRLDVMAAGTAICMLQRVAWPCMLCQVDSISCGHSIPLKSVWVLKLCAHVGVLCMAQVACGAPVPVLPGLTASGDTVAGLGPASNPAATAAGGAAGLATDPGARDVAKWMCDELVARARDAHSVLNSSTRMLFTVSVTEQAAIWRHNKSLANLHLLAVFLPPDVSIVCAAMQSLFLAWGGPTANLNHQHTITCPMPPWH